MNVNREIIRNVLFYIPQYLPRHPFLCCAADEARRNGKITLSEQEHFCEFIRERIKGHYTVMGWLKSTHGIDYSEYPREYRLEYRLLWTQKLIKEFSK